MKNQDRKSQSRGRKKTRERGGRRSLSNGLLRAFRGLVSKKKIRFQQNGYDLDLTYIIEENIIAMGVPAVGSSSMYRNDRKEVLDFFREFHPGKAKVYNLCVEYKYDGASLFGAGHYGYFPGPDHYPPTFQTMVDFAIDCDAWLKKDPLNVAAVHCKAGKGRTGTQICSYLVYSGLCSDAKQALNLFGMKRTANNKGVTIPSQQRYVRYMEAYAKEFKGRPFPSPPTISISEFILTGAPKFDFGGGCNPFVKVYQDGKKIYDQLKEGKKIPKFKKKHVSVSIKRTVRVTGDIKVVFLDYDRVGANEEMFHFLFHTSFVTGDFTLQKQTLDGAHKDSRCPKGMTLQVKFSGIPEDRKGRPDINAIEFVPERAGSRDASRSPSNSRDNSKSRSKSRGRG